MCGIFGVALTKRSELQVTEYTNLLAHRGPDDQGWLVWDREDGVQKGKQARNPQGSVFLGHRRLSILDLSSEGWQPMSSLDERFHIVFNGEIYNYREIRDELLELGYTFHSQSDTEVLLNAYIHWGKDVLPKLTGMFAFAVLDVENGQLFLARDHFGIKPLFYSNWEGGFAFSSEIKPLLSLPLVGTQINHQRVYEYLQFGTTDYGDETMLKDIQQLPSAHYMEVDLQETQIMSVSEFWRLDTSKKVKMSFEDAAAKLRELFLESVSLHLRSDVPVGAALSGGIDSSAIVCAIRYLQPDVEIHTFTYIAEEDAISEEKWANIIGKHVGAVMHRVKPDSSDMIRDLDKLVSVQNEPFGSTSIYAQYRVFQLANDAGIKVMLDGQGADEMLAGYSGYVGSRMVSLLKQGKFFTAYDFLNNATKLPDRNRKEVLKRVVGKFVPKQFLSIARRLAGRELISSWLDRDWLTRSGVRARSPNWDSSGSDCLREELARTLQKISIPSLLRYEDRNSMAHSIESRVPFLNHKMADFIFSLPEEFLLDQQGVTKAVFRKAMRGIVPDIILDRKDKIGFSTPEKNWLLSNAAWVEETLSEAGDFPMFQIKELQSYWAEVVKGKKPFTFQVWRLLNFIRWIKQSGIKLS